MHPNGPVPQAPQRKTSNMAFSPVTNPQPTLHQAGPATVVRPPAQGSVNRPAPPPIAILPGTGNNAPGPPSAGPPSAGPSRSQTLVSSPPYNPQVPTREYVVFTHNIMAFLIYSKFRQFIGEVLRPLKLKMEESWRSAMMAVDHLVVTQEQQFHNKWAHQQNIVMNLKNEVQQLKTENARIVHERDRTQEAWRLYAEKEASLASEVAKLTVERDQLQSRLNEWITLLGPVPEQVRQKITSLETELALARMNNNTGAIISKATANQVQKIGLEDADPSMIEELSKQLKADLDELLKEKLNESTLKAF
jgi:hypothetical protein